MEKIVLVVDDNPSALREMRTVLKETVYTVLTTNSSAEALRIVREQPVSVLLADYDMPFINGATLLSQTATIRPTMVRIILGDGTQQLDVVNALNKGGAYRYLTKPCVKEELLGVLEKAFVKWESQNRFSGISGLLMQRLFQQRLQTQIEHKDSIGVAVFYIAIKDWDNIQETFGTEKAQALVPLLGALFASNLPENALLGLMDNGYFAMAVNNINSVAEAVIAITQFAQRIGYHVEMFGRLTRIGLNAGFSLSGMDGKNATELLSKSFSALNHVQNSDLDDYCHYKSRMNESKAYSYSIKTQLSKALEREEFELHFQPTVRLEDQTLCGAEAYLRWNSKELGAVAPYEFLPVAIKTGIIHELGVWTIDQAIDQWVSWFGSSQSHLRISINMSMEQLMYKDLPTQIEKILSAKQVNTKSLEFDLDGFVELDDFDPYLKNIAAIKELGALISLNNVRQNRNSMYCLKNVPANVVKLDRTLMRGMLHSSAGYINIKSMIEIVHRSNLEVAAEGVEYQEELQMLTLLHCDIAQGYVYSPSVNAKEFLDIISKFSDNDTVLRQKAS